MCLKSMSRRIKTHSYHRNRETHLNLLTDVKLRQSQWSVKCSQGHWVMVRLEENVMDIYYVRSYTLSYERCRETHIYSLLDVKFDKVIRVRNVGQEH